MLVAGNPESTRGRYITFFEKPDTRCRRHCSKTTRLLSLPPRYKVTYRYLTVPGAQRPAYTRSFWAACSRTPGRSKQDSSHQSTTGPARSAAPTTPGNAVRTKVPAGAPKKQHGDPQQPRQPAAVGKSQPPVVRESPAGAGAGAGAELW